MKQRIKEIFSESIAVKKRTNLHAQISAAVLMIHDSMERGGKLLVCGNGGSAEQAQHFVGEFVGKYKKHRPPMAALALASHTPYLTAWSNDYEFHTAFSRELEAVGKRGDVLVAISTSGNSKNVLLAVRAAKKLSIRTIGLSGQGGQLKSAVDLALAVPSEDTARIQETHLTIIHIISELVEDLMHPDHDDKNPAHNQRVS